jgi:hypothetical protein
MKGIVLATFAVSSPVVALRIYRKHCNTFWWLFLVASML